MLLSAKLAESGTGKGLQVLIQFVVANYRSIKDEAVLSLAAGPGMEHRERNVRVSRMGGPRAMPLLRSAAVYGANAAGKTNLIRALAAMRTIVVNSSQANAELPVTPFLLDTEHKDQPTRFEIACVVDGVRYQYGFSATREVVVGEWLHAWPRGRPQLWFERRRAEDGAQTFEFGGKLLGDRQVWRRATRDNALFLSTAATLNAAHRSAQMHPLYDWFDTCLHVVGIGGWSPLYSARCGQGERKGAVVRFLQAADLAVSDLRVADREITEGMIPDELPSGLREEMKKALVGENVLEVHLVHQDLAGRPVELDLDEESDGTQKMFALAGPWVDVLEKGHVVVVDELHDNLHPMLVRHLVERFHDPALESDAQLVFTTHDTSILSQDVFRRDQIWFCERNAHQETALVPLSDFRPRKGLENLERGYLAGRYGAVPYIRSA